MTHPMMLYIDYDGQEVEVDSHWMLADFKRVMTEKWRMGHSDKVSDHKKNRKGAVVSMQQNGQEIHPKDVKPGLVHWTRFSGSKSVAIVWANEGAQMLHLLRTRPSNNKEAK